MFVAKNPLHYVIFIIIFIVAFGFLWNPEILPKELVSETLKHNVPTFSYRGKPYPPVTFLFNTIYSQFKYETAWLIQKILFVLTILIIGIIYNRFIRNFRILPFNSILPLYITTIMFVVVPINYIGISDIMGLLFVSFTLIMWNYFFLTKNKLWLFYIGSFSGLAVISNYGILLYLIIVIPVLILFGIFPRGGTRFFLQGLLSVILPAALILIFTDQFYNFILFSFAYYFSHLEEIFIYDKYLLPVIVVLVIGLIAFIKIRRNILYYKINFRYMESFFLVSFIVSLILFSIYRKTVFFEILLLSIAFYIINYLGTIKHRLWRLIIFISLFGVFAYFSYINYYSKPTFKSELKYIENYISKDKSICYLSPKGKFLSAVGYETKVPMLYYGVHKKYLELTNKDFSSNYFRFIIENFPDYILIAKGEEDIIQSLPLLELFYSRRVYLKDGSKLYFKNN